MNDTDIISKIHDNMPNGCVLLYTSKMGSKLYGTSTPDSDTDVKFIFAPSKESCYLCNAPKNININSSGDAQKNTKDDIDIQGWSIQFFIGLLRTGDTNALDLLYSVTNNEAVVFMHEAVHNLFRNPTRYFDMSNMRGMLGYIVTQSERYGLKGSRYKALIEVKEHVDEIRKYADITVDTKLGDYAGVIIGKNADQLYCKYEKTSDDRDALRLLGKVHMYDISFIEFERRVLGDAARYGDRTKASLDGSDWKALSHAYRCVMQAIELINTGNIVFPLRCALDVKNMKLGNLDKNHVDELIENGIQEIRQLVNTSAFGKFDGNVGDNLIKYLYSKYIPS